MNAIPQYCQKCREKNALGETTCRRCGTRLMLVVFPQSLKYDTNYVPTYYEDHLLERVTSLELRLSQITERLAMTLDLMLRQTKTTHTDHLLLETLVESLDNLGVLEKDKVGKNWHERVVTELEQETKESRRSKILEKILAVHDQKQPDLFAHLIGEGIKFLDAHEEKQGLRMLERASLLSPKNTPLFIFIAETLFRADKPELAKSYLEKSLANAPRDAKISLLLAVVSADQGQIITARKYLKRLISKKQAAFCANYIEAMVAALEADWPKSLAAFKETLIVKDLPEIHYLTGCVYFQLGRNKMALRHLQKAVEIDPGFADAWYMLGIVYQLAGEEKKMQEAIELAWESKEIGAQCLEFLKRKKQEDLQIALPFLRLKAVKNHLLTGGSTRLSRLFREEVFKAVDNLN